jgi:ribose 5-phosphate isomerase B
MKLSVGGDHAGFPLKATIIEVCRSLGHDVTDRGCHDTSPVDFPDITRAVCADVVAGKAERAILVCGTGVGASIAANKLRGIRASAVHDGHIAHQCVEHDDVNVMCIGAPRSSGRGSPRIWFASISLRPSAPTRIAGGV